MGKKPKKPKTKPKDKAATALFGVVLGFVLKIAVSVVFLFWCGFLYQTIDVVQWRSDKTQIIILHYLKSKQMHLLM